MVFAGRVPGGVIAYQTAFTFFLLPHALFAHPIFTVRFPELAATARPGTTTGSPPMSRRAADDGPAVRAGAALLAAWRHRCSPSSASASSTRRAASSWPRCWRLHDRALGYSCFFLLTRASYAIDDVRSPTTVFLGVTAAAIVGMAVTSSLVDGDAQVIVLGLANGVALSLGSAALYRRLRRRVDRPMPILATLLRIGSRPLSAPGSPGRPYRHRLGRAGRGVATLLVGGTVGLAAYGTMLLVLREPEVLALRGRIGPRG